MEPERRDLAEYLVDEVRQGLALDQVPSGPCDHYVLHGPSVPVSASAGDATASFDGERIRLDWNWKTEESKKSGGPRTILLPDLELVEWVPAAGLENGYLRFVVAKATATAAPKYDPHAVVLYGFKKDPLMALVAAAVVARMPHPGAPAKALPAQPPAPEPSADTPPTGGDEGDVDHDVLLRRLRELGDLHQSGILTEAEFTTAKQAVLRRFSGA
ncbi:DUF4429 domain-containing protein [Streptomyces melanosporofaciens]|uniref:DUF4429 domain-containing protein n=1 Tax=Streptomyces melanosporofaciens TaxID=67327 RepID=UPI000B33621C